MCIALQKAAVWVIDATMNLPPPAISIVSLELLTWLDLLAGAAGMRWRDFCVRLMRGRWCDG